MSENDGYEVPVSPVRQGLAEIERGHLVYANTGLARLDCDLASVTVPVPSPEFESAVASESSENIYEIVGVPREQENVTSSVHDRDLGAAAPPAGDDSVSGGDGEQQQQQSDSVLSAAASVGPAPGTPVGSVHPAGVGALSALASPDEAGFAAGTAELRPSPDDTLGRGAESRRQARSPTRRRRGAPRELPPRRAPSSRVAARRLRMDGGAPVDVDPLQEDLDRSLPHEVNKTLCWSVILDCRWMFYYCRNY